MPEPGSGTATLVFLHRGDQLLGGNQLQSVLEIGARSQPSDTYFQTRIPWSRDVTRAEAQAVANTWAGIIEPIFVQPYIVALGYFQDPLPNGALVDKIEAFWEVPDQSVQGSVQVVMSTLMAQRIAELVQAEVANLSP